MNQGRPRIQWIWTWVVLASTVPAFAADPGPLAKAVQPFVDREELAGAVMLVANKEKVLTVEAAGFADIAGKKPMLVDSMFWIASQTKPITGAALMILIDEGKVNADDPVEKYLPEFKGQMVIAEKTDSQITLKKPSHPITVKNVLTHTSGLPFKTAIETPTLDRLPLADRVRSYAMVPLDFEPDTKYQYSNCGINVAGRIVEVVSGKSFEEFLEERLLKPLGMTETTFYPSDEQAARIAKSYGAGPDKKGVVETTIPQLHYPLSDKTARASMPAGGLFSTANDLSRFYRMLLNGGELDGKRVLSEAAVKTLTSRQTAEGLTPYGFGFATGGNRIGHGGAFSTNSYIDTERGQIFIWLVQHASFPGMGNASQDAFRKAAIESFTEKK